MMIWRCLFIGCLLSLAQPSPETKITQQAVLETSKGKIIIDLYADKAPRHVDHFSKLIQSGEMKGCAFHRVIAGGIIQGGDPLSKDPAKSAQHGTGGLRKLKAEFNEMPFKAGSVAAVLIPNEPDSAGDQFFICVSDQLQLNGQYTLFGRVSEGMPVVEDISRLEADANQQPKERIVITDVTLRPYQPPPPPAFSRTSIEELAHYRVRILTSAGEILLSLHPEKAPETVRHFLRLCEAGVYDSTSFHRIVPGFVIQTGHVGTRRTPLTPLQRPLVQPVKAEFNDLQHAKGTVALARGNDPDSGEDSFFICLARQSSLDGKYTAFASVTEGLDVVDRIAAASLKSNSEEPVERIEIAATKLEKK